MNRKHVTYRKANNRPGARLRRRLAPRLDTFALQRFRQLTRRGERGNDPHAVQQEAIDAFGRVVENVRAGGRMPQNYTATVVRAFDGLKDHGGRAALAPQRLRQTVIDQFHQLYYHSAKSTWKNTDYRGVKIWKCPLDMWLYQEILHEVAPDLIIETGTAFGGSAYYLADLCETMGRGQVVTIDVKQPPGLPEHQRLTYLNGSSVDPEIVATVKRKLPEAATVLVILDSNHSASHVRQEIKTWSSWVTPGSYLIVEDSNINGNPVQTTATSGPMEAIDEFLKDNSSFIVDESKHKFLLTFNPRGYLKRTR